MTSMYLCQGVAFRDSFQIYQSIYLSILLLLVAFRDPFNLFSFTSLSFRKRGLVSLADTIGAPRVSAWRNVR
jgi:hypothetical protein